MNALSSWSWLMSQIKAQNWKSVQLAESWSHHITVISATRPEVCWSEHNVSRESTYSFFPHCSRKDEAWTLMVKHMWHSKLKGTWWSSSKLFLSITKETRFTQIYTGNGPSFCSKVIMLIWHIYQLSKLLKTNTRWLKLQILPSRWTGSAMRHAKRRRPW